MRKEPLGRDLKTNGDMIAHLFSSPPGGMNDYHLDSKSAVVPGSPATGLRLLSLDVLFAQGGNGAVIA
jgi:hypothetical protein